MKWCDVTTILVEGDGFEPSKAYAGRFTVCSLWPLGNPSILGGRSRPPSLGTASRALPPPRVSALAFASLACFRFAGLLSFALLCFALLCFALLCFALLCFALLCFAGLLCLLAFALLACVFWTWRGTWCLCAAADWWGVFGFQRAGGRTRTDYLLITNQLLCQVSYASETSDFAVPTDPGSREGVPIINKILRYVNALRALRLACFLRTTLLPLG